MVMPMAGREGKGIPSLGLSREEFNKTSTPGDPSRKHPSIPKCASKEAQDNKRGGRGIGVELEGCGSFKAQSGTWPFKSVSETDVSPRASRLAVYRFAAPHSFRVTKGPEPQRLPALKGPAPRKTRRAARRPVGTSYHAPHPQTLLPLRPPPPPASSPSLPPLSRRLQAPSNQPPPCSQPWRAVARCPGRAQPLVSWGPFH